MSKMVDLLLQADDDMMKLSTDMQHDLGRLILAIKDHDRSACLYLSKAEHALQILTC